MFITQAKTEAPLKYLILNAHLLVSMLMPQMVGTSYASLLEGILNQTPPQVNLKSYHCIIATG